MAALIIGEKEKAEIAAAIARARQHPMPVEAVVAGALPDKATVNLADRKPNWERTSASEQVLLPVGYRAAVSFEEQPAGLCIHLSISAERKNPRLMPHPEAIAMIAGEFGIDVRFVEGRMEGPEKLWIEEYEPGRHAVNLLKVVELRQGGRA